VIRDGRIAHLGTAPADLQPDERIDGSGRAALPGLVNAHCHSPMTFERGWAEDLPFERWLNEKIWVQESVLTSDDVYWGAALAACEMIRSGTVAFNDKYFHMDRVAEVVAQSGLKAGLTWTVFGLDNDREFTGGPEGPPTDPGNPWGGRRSIRPSSGRTSPYICPKKCCGVRSSWRTSGRRDPFAPGRDRAAGAGVAGAAWLRPAAWTRWVFDAGRLCGRPPPGLTTADNAIWVEKGVHRAHRPITR
jgi:hypothetical protein